MLKRQGLCFGIMQAPVVDITIAVHTHTRPIARAVSSVLNHTVAPVRVIVVAHNIKAETIRANLGAYATDQRVEVLELIDGVPSPAGPMNYGFAHSTAPFISLLGSDDELEPGAIDSWLAMQRDTGAEMVLARIIDKAQNDPYPPVRGGRRIRALDAVRDRLAYRSTPVGLISRERFGDLRLAEGLPSGEDLSYSLSIFFTAAILAYDLQGPAYVLHDDAQDRVTSEPRDVLVDFAYLHHIEQLEWFAQATPSVRRAVVLKLIRMHFFDAVRARTTSAAQFHACLPELVAVIEELIAWSPGVLAWLSRGHAETIAEIRAEHPRLNRVRELLTASARYHSSVALLSSNPFLALHAQAPFRTLFAGLLARRRADAARSGHESSKTTLRGVLGAKAAQCLGGSSALIYGASELQMVFA